MTTKEKILKLLEEQRGKAVSGEKLATETGVSRTAVWKAVESLRTDGYAIEAVTNRGYCLPETSDVLSEEGIRSFLKDRGLETTVTAFRTVTSTNDYIKKQAAGGAEEGLVAVADEQTKGRGRYQRSFFSPKGTGIYLSLLLRPTELPPQQAVRMTTAAAVAMCEAIEEISDLKPKIKWVNDIYVNGKKICGILTEAAMGLESGRLDYAVLGVGINVYTPKGGFPPEIEQKAGALFDKPSSNLKNRLTAAFLNHFMHDYRENNPKDYSKRYRAYSLTVGRTVTVVGDDKREQAKVVGIDDECRLQLLYPDGRTQTLAYGEIDVEGLA